MFKPGEKWLERRTCTVWIVQDDLRLVSPHSGLTMTNEKMQTGFFTRLATTTTPPEKET